MRLYCGIDLHGNNAYVVVLDERNRALFVAAQHPAPRRVLLVGGALGRLPGELLRAGVEHVTDVPVVAIGVFTAHGEDRHSFCD